MSEELEVVVWGDQIEISVNNGVSGGWVRFPLIKASQVIAALLEIRTQDLRQRNVKLDKDSTELRKSFDKDNFYGNLTPRSQEW